MQGSWHQYLLCVTHRGMDLVPPCLCLCTVPTSSSVPGCLTFLCVVVFHGTVMCYPGRESNTDNVCIPTIPAGINRPPHLRPSRIYPECRAHETRLAGRSAASVASTTRRATRWVDCFRSRGCANPSEARPRVGKWSIKEPEEVSGLGCGCEAGGARLPRDPIGFERASLKKSESCEPVVDTLTSARLSPCFMMEANTFCMPNPIFVRPAVAPGERLLGPISSDGRPLNEAEGPPARGGGKKKSKSEDRAVKKELNLAAASTVAAAVPLPSD